MDHPEGTQQKHIMQQMMRCREDAQMSYANHYKRIIHPFAEYIKDQMDVHNISSPIEMAVIMIQEAEHEQNAEVLIMNIMAGAMEVIDPGQR